MPVEFKLQNTENFSDSTRLAMMYDCTDRRISKTLPTNPTTATSLEMVKVTHYTGIGTEIREEFHSGSRERVSVVVNMPQRLGRNKVADASQPAGDNASRTFEWYLKNHLGSTMLVYGTVSSTDPNTADIGETKAAYDYRAFGEMVTLSQPSDKVTENFTGKELDDETKLSNHGARLLVPMLGVWISVDPKRFFPSPYLYMGNGYNPIRFADLNGEWPGSDEFDSPAEVTYDWMICINPWSKALNVEHFSFIFKNKNGKYIASHPTMGSVDGVTLKQIQSNLHSSNNKSFFDMEIVGMIHSHGASNFWGIYDGYDNENFSNNDMYVSNLLGLDFYLVTPSNRIDYYQTGTVEVKEEELQ